MQNQKKKGNKLVFILKKLHQLWRWCSSKRDKLNHLMHKKYTSGRVAFAASLAITLLWIIMLFVPPYLGVADDGSLYKVMDRAGLSYIEGDADDIYNNYYVREYLIHDDITVKEKAGNSQDLFVRAAVFIDQMITGDQTFDLRFLALLYGIFYIPAIFLIVNNACKKVSNFSEAAFIGILGVFIFGDISYITYFSSFYPEALWIVCLASCIGWICNLESKKGGYINLIALLIYGIIFTTTRQQCAVIGFILAGFFIRVAFINKKFWWKTSCVLFSFIMSMTGVFSVGILESDFSLTSKYHTMTRGVLFQASNPEKALEEFGIDPSYSIMSKTSAYNYYPFILPDDPKLKEEFYNQYDTADIIIYYIKHPVSFLRMLDLSVKNETNLHRDYCGNYEKNHGMPKMAKGIFWSGWNYFKVRSAPQTIAYPIILLILSYLISISKRKEKRTEIEKGSYNLTNLTFILLAIGISQAAITIVMSGDAEFTQHAFLLGSSMDMIVYFIVAEALSKLKIFEDGGRDEK